MLTIILGLVRLVYHEFIKNNNGISDSFLYYSLRDSMALI